VIPVCEPTLKGNEIKYVNDAVSSGWISSSGKYIAEFETKFAEYCGVSHGISCSSGTAALHLAIEALGIGKGDEVIVPTFTMAASSNAVIYAGAKPVFVDSELETWNMDPDKIEEKITERTKAIMVVHTYGHPVDMDRIRLIANRYDLKIIEDAAEAHGAEYKGRKAGSLGDIACFSFYANKIITTGEGGMIVTNNKEWAERARSLKNHFFGGPGEPRFIHKELGHCLRMTNLQAALGLAQLEQITDFVNSRRINARLYNQLLKDIKGITLPPEKEWAKNVYWMYGILISEEFGMSMTQLKQELKRRGIDTRTFFVGMHKQPMYEKEDPRFPQTGGDYPCAEELERRGLYLPSASHLSKEQIFTVVDTIKEVQREALEWQKQNQKIEMKISEFQ
jgi:perosamine synthetase